MSTNFFPENGAVYYKVENLVQPDSPQMKTQFGACALHAG